MDMSSFNIRNQTSFMNRPEDKDSQFPTEIRAIDNLRNMAESNFEFLGP